MKKNINFSTAVLGAALPLLLVGCEKKDANPGPIMETLTSNTENITNATISEDGATIYYSTYNNTHPNNTTQDIFALDAQSKVSTFLVNTNGFIDKLAISRDSRRLLYDASMNINNGVQSVLRLYDIPEKKETTIVSGGNSDLHAYAFVKNDTEAIYGKRMHLQGPDINCSCNTLWKVNLQDMSTSMISPMENAVLSAVYKNNKLLVDTYARYYTMSFDGGSQKEVEKSHQYKFTRFSPDGNQLLGRKTTTKENPVDKTTQYETHIVTRDLNTAKETVLMTAAAEGFAHGYSLSGKKILFSLNKGAPGMSAGYELFLMDSDGSNIKQLTFNNFGEDPVGFIDNDRKLVFTSTHEGTRRLYTLTMPL